MSDLCSFSSLAHFNLPICTGSLGSFSSCIHNIHMTFALFSQAQLLPPWCQALGQPLNTKCLTRYYEDDISGLLPLMQVQKVGLWKENTGRTTLVYFCPNYYDNYFANLFYEAAKSLNLFSWGLRVSFSLFKNLIGLLNIKVNMK